ncbi:MAG: RNA pyrophosphohydrolase [Glaciecola sp.]|nr:RNA pyrophosphohydrolase [Glaciecola sp.]MDG1815183.1 RNA pyrophosphohydrolase [Glaciecola sp.]MDG2099916.1 RNA pyrophosphohydrolase [Glaciecola sp.]
MIDTEGFRANVGIIICNKQGQVFWARRYGQHSWQFPQGGIDQGENPEQAMYRELHEEVGLKPTDVELLGVTRNWIRYKLPKRLIRSGTQPVCIGQKQKWYLLRLTCEEKDVDVLHSSHPEFDDWRWTSFWYPIRNVVSFKREVYRRALKELMPFVFNGLKQQAKSEQKTTQKQNPNRSSRRNKTRRRKRPTN